MLCLLRVVTRVLLCAMGSASFSACRHAPARRTEGESSFRFVEPPAAPPPKAKISAGEAMPAVQTINAQPILPLTMPVYPPTALTARAGAVTIGVHLTVDAEGRVSDVRPSLMTLTMPSPFAAEFQAAAETAVAQWRFRPAEIRHLELVKDQGGDFQRVTGREKIEWTFDVEFAFRLSGDVQAGTLKE